MERSSECSKFQLPAELRTAALRQDEDAIVGGVDAFEHNGGATRDILAVVENLIPRIAPSFHRTGSGNKVEAL
jgi:hypothetical protein